MSNTPIEKNSRTSPLIRYLMMSFYFLFIGFCAVGIWIKWGAIDRASNQYTSHQYEEGFDAVAVTVPLPREELKISFLERLGRRGKPKPAPVIEPERNEQGTDTWQKYAASAVMVPRGNAKITLVIDDLGIVRDTTQQIIDMDAPLTLSFLPYASEVSSQVSDAYERGHDILVHMPMEPKGKADPGPHALFSSTSSRAQMESINYNLGQFSNYIGINNHMGSEFTEDAVAVERLLNVVKDKGLLVLDSKTTPKSLLEDIAYKKNIPVTNRDIFLDNEQNLNYIMDQLSELERIAKREGSALAIGHPYSQTVAALKIWIPTLAAKGITIVPISQKIREKYSYLKMAAD